MGSPMGGTVHCPRAYAGPARCQLRIAPKARPLSSVGNLLGISPNRLGLFFTEAQRTTIRNASPSRAFQRRPPGGGRFTGDRGINEGEPAEEAPFMPRKRLDRS